MSISGGVDTAFDRGERVGCDAMQIFTKNNNQWRAAPLKEEAVDRYFRRQAETGIMPVVAHSSYLLNLAIPRTCSTWLRPTTSCGTNPSKRF
jgi:deoxyribonuclease-4